MVACLNKTILIPCVCSLQNDGKGKQIKDLCSDAFEIGEDQQGYPIYEGKLTKVKIFERYDVDRDGKLNQMEYRRYLQGVGEWGAMENYTDEKWDESWPEECEQMESGTEGIGWEAFEGILYAKHRLGKAQADLESCKRPQPEPEPELGIMEPEPEPA